MSGAALERSAVQRFLLEKPLGPDPASALALFDALEQAGRAMRLGFIFTYAPWVDSLRDWIAEADEDAQLVIDWRFRAHHYATGLDTWKRRTSAGGGALRFYGIHLIALMAELGYASLSSSRVWSRHDDETEAWEASFAGTGKADLPHPGGLQRGRHGIRSRGRGQEGRALGHVARPLRPTSRS